MQIKTLRSLTACSSLLALMAGCTLTVKEGEPEPEVEPESSSETDSGAPEETKSNEEDASSADGSETDKRDSGTVNGDSGSSEPDSEMGADSNAGEGEGADGGGNDAAAETEPKVDAVSTVGVGVSADLFCSEGRFTVTVQPKDADGKLVISDAEDVECSAQLGDSPVTCEVSEVNCDAGSDSSGTKTVVLVIVDDSGSMDDNDPDNLRASACQTFVDQLGDEDAVIITDFGNGGSGEAEALQTLQGLTEDKTDAKAACAGVESGPTGTPIYASVVDAANVFYPSAQSIYGDDVNFSVLMLSDGEPDSDLATRAEALEAASDAGIPIFTIGLGPAAEGGELTNSDAVGVLTELSEETGAAYASSQDPEGLDSLFQKVGNVVREGSCQVSAQLSAGAFVTGEQVEGSLVFEGAAETTFGFSVPASELEASRCE